MRLGDRIGRVACVSLQGYYPYDPYKPNQDKYNVVNDVTGDGSSNWYIVLDGHGNDGHFCAEAGKDQVSACLLSAIPLLGQRPFHISPGVNERFIGPQLPVVYKELLNSKEHSGLSVADKLIKAHVDVNEKVRFLLAVGSGSRVWNGCAGVRAGVRNE